jgi:hypothetical protein
MSKFDHFYLNTICEINSEKQAVLSLLIDKLCQAGLTAHEWQFSQNNIDQHLSAKFKKNKKIIKLKDLQNLESTKINYYLQIEQSEIQSWLRALLEPHKNFNRISDIALEIVNLNTLSEQDAYKFNAETFVKTNIKPQYLWLCDEIRLSEKHLQKFYCYSELGFTKGKRDGDPNESFHDWQSFMLTANDKGVFIYPQSTSIFPLKNDLFFLSWDQISYNNVDIMLRERLAHGLSYVNQTVDCRECPHLTTCGQQGLLSLMKLYNLRGCIAPIEKLTTSF